MKTIIAGGRDVDYYWPDLTSLALDSGFDVTEVVSGACPTGIDLAGKKWACAKGLDLTEFPADWQTHGKSAGPIRNGQMAEYADALILIWDGKSRGSANMLKQAEAHGLRVYEHRVVA